MGRFRAFKRTQYKIGLALCAGACLFVGTSFGHWFAVLTSGLSP